MADVHPGAEESVAPKPHLKLSEIDVVHCPHSGPLCQGEFYTLVGLSGLR